MPAVKVAMSHSAGNMVIQITGDAGVTCACALQDGLLASSACRPAVVTLDLRELHSISCLAMRVLVAFRRGVVRTGGRVRVAEALQPAVREALARAELLSLFETSTDTEPAPHRQASPTRGSQVIS
jgi:anti-anti-sigma factor